MFTHKYRANVVVVNNTGQSIEWLELRHLHEPVETRQVFTSVADKSTTASVEVDFETGWLTSWDHWQVTWQGSAGRAKRAIKRHYLESDDSAEKGNVEFILNADGKFELKSPADRSKGTITKLPYRLDFAAEAPKTELPYIYEYDSSELGTGVVKLRMQYKEANVASAVIQYEGGGQFYSETLTQEAINALGLKPGALQSPSQFETFFGGQNYNISSTGPSLKVTRSSDGQGFSVRLYDHESSLKAVGSSYQLAVGGVILMVTGGAAIPVTLGSMAFGSGVSGLVYSFSQFGDASKGYGTPSFGKELLIGAATSLASGAAAKGVGFVAKKLGETAAKKAIASGGTAVASKALAQTGAAASKLVLQEAADLAIAEAGRAAARTTATQVTAAIAGGVAGQVTHGVCRRGGDTTLKDVLKDATIGVVSGGAGAALSVFAQHTARQMPEVFTRTAATAVGGAIGGVASQALINFITDKELTEGLALAASIGLISGVSQSLMLSLAEKQFERDSKGQFAVVDEYATEFAGQQGEMNMETLHADLETALHNGLDLNGAEMRALEDFFNGNKVSVSGEMRNAEAFSSLMAGNMQSQPGSRPDIMLVKLSNREKEKVQEIINKVVDWLIKTGFKRFSKLASKLFTKMLRTLLDNEGISGSINIKPNGDFRIGVGVRM